MSFRKIVLAKLICFLMCGHVAASEVVNGYGTLFDDDYPTLSKDQAMQKGVFFTVNCGNIYKEITLLSKRAGKEIKFYDFSFRLAAGDPVELKELMAMEASGVQFVNRVKSIKILPNEISKSYSRCTNKNADKTIFPMESYDSKNKIWQSLQENGFTVYLSGSWVDNKGRKGRELFSATHMHFPCDEEYSVEDSIHVFINVSKISLNLEIKRPVFEVELDHVNLNGLPLVPKFKSNYISFKFQNLDSSY